MSIEEWIVFFEEMDINQPKKFGFQVAIGTPGKSFIQNSEATFEEDLKELKRQVGSNISYTAKLYRLNQQPNPEPTMPNLGTHLDRIAIAEAHYQLRFNYYQFVNAYKKFLEVKIKEEIASSGHIQGASENKITSPNFELSRYDMNCGANHPYFHIGPVKDSFYKVYEGASGINRFQYFKVPQNSKAGELCEKYIQKYNVRNEHRFNKYEESNSLIDVCNSEAVEIEAGLSVYLKYWNECLTTTDKKNTISFHHIYHVEALKEWYTIQLGKYTDSLKDKNASEPAKQADMERWKGNFAKEVADYLNRSARQGIRQSAITYDHAEQLIQFYYWLTGTTNENSVSKNTRDLPQNSTKEQFYMNQNVDSVSQFLIELQTLEIRVLDKYILNGEYLQDIDPVEYPGMQYKTVQVLDLSNYKQEGLRYENRLRREQKTAEYKLSLLEKEHISRQLVLLQDIKLSLQNFFNTYSEIAASFANGTLTMGDLLMKINAFFILPETPVYASITPDFIEDLQSAAMFKQAALLEFEDKVIRMAGVKVHDSQGNVMPGTDGKAEVINVFCKAMPLSIPKEHFKVFYEQTSKNKAPFLTSNQFELFIQKAFLGNDKINKLSLNVGQREKLFIIKRFYEFYNLSAYTYENTSQCQEKYIKLITDNFDNWTYKSVADNFGNKVKRQW